jgi:hypothetical protein
VVELPTKHVMLRSGRHIRNEAGEYTEEMIFIVEVPDFDIQTIIGMHLLPVSKVVSSD